MNNVKKVTMNIDQLKSQWKNLNPQSGIMDGVHDSLLAGHRYKRAATLADKLRRRYLRATVLCLLAPVLMCPVSRFIDMPLPLMIAYPAYFAVMLVFNLILCRRVKKLEPLDCTVKDALIRVTGFAILRRRLESVGIMLAIPLMVYLIWIFKKSGDTGLWWGAIAGAVIGVGIGLIVDVHTVRIIRQMKADLSRELGD